MKYIVKITETIQNRVSVEAASPTAALHEIEDAYNNGEIILDKAPNTVNFEVLVDMNTLVGPCGNPKAL